MIETITPVVHGGRTLSYWTSVGMHVLAATATAAALGAALGLVGTLVGPSAVVAAAAVGLIALLYAARELAGLPIPLPERRRQVPEWWRTFFSPGVAAALYGAGLGI